MTREVPLDVMNSMRYFHLFYLRARNPGKKLDKQNLTLDELLEFWGNELKNLKTTDPIEKYCIPIARKGYENAQNAAKKYL